MSNDKLLLTCVACGDISEIGSALDSNTCCDDKKLVYDLFMEVKKLERIVKRQKKSEIRIKTEVIESIKEFLK